VIKLDDALMGYLIANASGEFTPQDVVSFLSKPLNIGTQISIVENSMVYKSSASVKADLTQMAQNPAVAQRLAQDAETLDVFLKAFNMEQLRDASAAHRERAERENETFLDMIRLGQNLEGIARPIVIFEDDDIIHEAKHIDFIVRYWDVVRNNPQFLMDFYIHLEKHRMQKEEKEAKVLAGASLATGQMVALGAQQKPPGLQEISQDAQLKKLQEQMMAGAKTPPDGGAPPGAAPKSPDAPAATSKPGAT
jgi:hypothetical protein